MPPSRSGRIRLGFPAGILAAALVLFVGCAAERPKSDGSAQTVRQTTALRLGMKMDEVRAIWGPPDATPKAWVQDGAEIVIWEYRVPRRVDRFTFHEWMQLTFENGVLRGWQAR